MPDCGYALRALHGDGTVDLTRRNTLFAGLSFGVAGTLPAWAASDDGIHVVKDPGCPCCNAWIGHLRDNGFRVTFEERPLEAVHAFKRERGIPPELASCHTAVIGGYTVEGHVPAADIRRLMTERPVAIGLSVPGMPFGSPGMGPESAREAFDVILVGTDASGSVFTRYPAA